MALAFWQKGRDRRVTRVCVVSRIALERHGNKVYTVCPLIEMRTMIDTGQG